MRHRNVKKIRLADLDKKVMSGIDYIDPSKTRYKTKCVCRGTKVDGKCIMEEKCNWQATIYCDEWTPTKNFYIGKPHGPLRKRQRDHVQRLGEFFKQRKDFQDYQILNSQSASQEPTAKNQ